ncbi:MAG TPA: hypothetical protein VFE46_10160 [Pirellulales bacterium]|jgi:hypothetical protein|nr:hypothetical protein [Pirellulales bacterium]
MADSALITWFTEDPTPILIGGGVILFVLGVLFLKYGRAGILVAMAGIALVMGSAMLIDHLVVTEREQVANVIYNAADAAERNDFDACLACISPMATEVKTEARHWIAQAKFDSVSISGMEVKLDRTTNPMTATAEFRAFATGLFSDRGSPYPFKYVSHLAVKLQKQGTHWLVMNYQHD